MPELTISLDTEQLECVQREAEHRQLTPEQLVKAILREQLRFPSIDTTWRMSAKELIALLSAPEPEVRKRATGRLAAFGPSAIPQLEAALETAEGSLLLAIAELLALLGVPSAILPLLIASTNGSSSQKPSLYLSMLLERYDPLPDSAWKAIRICTPRTAPLVSRQIKMSLFLTCGPEDSIDPTVFRELATVAEIASLTALLRWQRTGDVARQAATALHQIALTAPVPQLREALPYLHRAWHIRFAHPELLQARRAIEAATVLWKDLPLPVESDSERAGQNLPVPVE